MEMNKEKSLCGTCRDPGACCRSIQIPREFLPGTTRKEVERHLKDGTTNIPGQVLNLSDPRPLPFTPLREATCIGPETGYSKEITSVKWVYTCPMVTDEGRCSIYENRPEICKLYEPGSDPMCVHHDGSRTYVWAREDLTQWDSTEEDTTESIQDEA